MLNFSTQTIIPHLQNKNRISGSLLPYTNLTNVATMPTELKHFQDICTDCTFLKQTKMQEQSVHHVSNWTTGWKQQCNKWDYKGTSLHKRGNENAAYRELEECVTTAQSQLGEEKKRFNQTFIGFNVIHFYKKIFTQSHLCFYVVFLGSLVLYFGSFHDRVCLTGPYYHRDLVCGNVLCFCYAF